ncbi:acyltransferase [Bacillus benzoevorans]|uniref:Acetyltransferase-like isoleucine patch superfamily enzyme n=1 Tax=Bacillus benzoevorans TaxID=1456 RepID=A0A7X0LWY0_9BACI|nr:hypothetical protein [Bacillus benzoevorans]MBB6447581.1 acetyltransferase-like isoleucine patch superfamily enzyme [Bacillus benzoevorans]
MVNSRAKGIIKKNQHFLQLTKIIYNLIFQPKKNIKGKENKIKNNGAWAKNIKVKIIGNNNEIIFKSNSNLKDFKIYINGNNNRIIIHENSFIENGEFFIEDDGNVIIINSNSTICFGFHFACIEGTIIEIGEDCLFSSNVTIRTGDSHSIVNMDGERINRSNNVSIGNHVWIGNDCTILKGSIIKDNTIVGTRSLVSKKFSETGLIITGVPAKRIKSGVNWDKQRIPY